MPIVYHAIGGTDSRYALGSPYGSLTRSYICCCMPIFVSPPPCGVRLDGGQDAMTHRHRGFGLPVLPLSPVIFSAVIPSETQRVSRGKLRLLSAHDRQIYGLRQRRIEDFVLCCGLVPNIARLKSACPPPLGAGHTCTSTRAFASGFLQAHIAVTPLPSATLRLRQAGSGLCPIPVS
jgi:hypothetical protein